MPDSCQEAQAGKDNMGSGHAF
ncbi:hypothetical protein CCACVL1_01394, partial [Corchorus capsularis]